MKTRHLVYLAFALLGLGLAGLLEDWGLLPQSPSLLSLNRLYLALAGLLTGLLLGPRLEGALEARLKRLESNRAKNFELADILREKLMQDFIALRNGTLKVERAVAYKGEVHHTEVEPGPQDMVALANAAKNVAEMTYRALGDVAAEDRQITPHRNGDGASITVILPTVVHTSNSSRQEKVVQQVIDLRPTALSNQRSTKSISDTSVIDTK